MTFLYIHLWYRYSFKRKEYIRVFLKRQCPDEDPIPDVRVRIRSMSLQVLGNMSYNKCN
jgi:hypothetical protein